MKEMLGYVALQVMLLLPNITNPNIVPEGPYIDIEIVEENLVFIRDQLSLGINHR